jgi:hypothetical protein
MTAIVDVAIATPAPRGLFSRVAPTPEENIAKIKTRLKPPSPAEIDAEVASLLARGDSFDWFQTALRTS